MFPRCNYVHYRCIPWVPFVLRIKLNMKSDNIAEQRCFDIPSVVRTERGPKVYDIWQDDSSFPGVLDAVRGLEVMAFFSDKKLPKINAEILKR